MTAGLLVRHALKIGDILLVMQLDANKEAQLQLLPQDRVLNVKPCWATTSNEGRVELLSISLEELRLKAIDLAETARKQAGTLCQHAVASVDSKLLCHCSVLSVCMCEPQLWQHVIVLSRLDNIVSFCPICNRHASSGSPPRTCCII